MYTLSTRAPSLKLNKYFLVPSSAETCSCITSALTSGAFSASVSLSEAGRLVIQDVLPECIEAVDEIISNSGDVLRLSNPDKKLISLAYMMSCEGKNVKVISDDYTIQNTLKIMGIPYSGIITEGIKGVYNWKKVCEGCKKEYDEDYPFDDCEICGSRIFKKRIKVTR